MAAIACGNSDTTANPAAEPVTVVQGGSDSSPDATEVAEVSASNGSSVTPTLKPPTAVPSQEEKAINIMWQMLDYQGQINGAAVIAAGRNGHPGLVPVLVEAAARVFDPDLAMEMAVALEEITGERVGGDFVLVAPWYSWMARQDPPQPELDEFDKWRGEFLGAIDPSFRQFIYEDVPSQIPIWTVQWGGVRRDGIPPLEFPKTIPASEADFLLADEPVFGVTINGESRAYPHRIMGWHELANDALGGELITFVF